MNIESTTTTNELINEKISTKGNTSKTIHELLNIKLPIVLKRHQLKLNSTLLEWRPAIANITKLDQCYEKGILGVDTKFNMFETGTTFEQIVKFFFNKLSNQINEQNAEKRIGALIHSIQLITDEVLDCDQSKEKRPIGLSPLSCLTIDEQVGIFFG
ncbi:hypothetical protein BLOT_014429 [Blomia tropicalis]|nr:hypothetical protein BLOT_014429 [Blomia tropicalis]